MKLKTKIGSYSTRALLFATLTVPAIGADYPSTVSSFSPLAYWRFDETATAPAPNSVANSGSLGAAGTGYVVLDVGLGEPGIVGTAIRLNNPGNTIGHCGSKVDVPFRPALNPAAPLSIEFWAKPNALTTDSTGVCPLSSFNPNWFGGGNRSGWLFYLNNSHWQFRLGYTAGGYAIQLTASTTPTLGWQHVVATYDGSTAKIYINGALAGSGPVPSGWIPNPQGALRMGGTPLTGDLADGPVVSQSGIAGNRGYDGWMDEVAVYSSTLSGSQVAAHFAAATTNNAGYGAQIIADGPVGYWHLDEPAVTAPDPSTYPRVVNSGTLGSAADGTNVWGAVTAQPGSGYAGLGATNKAIAFNGEAGYVQIKDAAGLHISGNMSVAAWVKPGVQDFYRDIVVHGWDPSFAETFLRIERGNDPTGYGYDNQNFYEFGATDGSTYNSAEAVMPPGDIGNWVFLVGTYDGANYNLYRNGALAATFASDLPPVDVTNAWTIGSRASETADAQHFAAEGLYFGGSIDEPAIFGIVLSPANVLSLYNAAQVSPVITRAVQTPTGVYKGSSASFSVWAEGSPTLSYLWLSNGISTGVTATNLTLNNLSAGSLTVAAVASNPYGSTTSSVTFLVVAAAPFFPQQPAALTRYTGRPFVFSVTAAGTTPLAYQWKTNGTAIPGATSSSYSNLASASLAANYSCTVSNEAGVSNTVAASLTVLALPGGYAGVVLADGPVSLWRMGEPSGSVSHDYWSGNDGTYFAATLGQPGYSAIDPDTAVSFSGVANSYVGGISGTAINFVGHTNFTIEAWVNGASGQSDESTVIAKGSGSSGTVANEQFSLDVAGGNYRFFTRGSANALFEADASTGPNGTWQHVVGVYDDTGGAITIYVNGQVQGTGSPRGSGLRVSSTQVTIGSKHLGNDPNFDGAFNGLIDEVAVYPYPLTPAQVTAHYAAAYGSSLRPAISLQPGSLTNYVTLPAVLSVGAFGTVPLSFQWKKGGVDLSDGGTISGASSSALSINPLVLGDSGNYTVTITNVNGSTNSAIASLTVLPAPVAPPAIAGLVVHLPFDNNLTDATGRGNNGTSYHQTPTTTNVEAATFATDGKIGQAYSYSSDMGDPGAITPTRTNNFYAQLGVRPDLQFSSNAPFTFAYWIRLPANYTAGDLPFFTTTVGSTFGDGIVFAPSFGPTAVGATTGTDPGGWAASFYDVNANGVGYYGDIGSINDGGWHHLVHVNDRATLVTYLDGVLARSRKQAGTSAAGASASCDTGSPATIGQDPTGHYGETGSADIDDLGVWRKALTPLEAAALYMAGNASGLSFVGAPITLTEQHVGNNLILSWPAGTLQSAPAVTGPFTDVTPKSPVTVPITGAQKFFRVRL